MKKYCAELQQKYAELDYSIMAFSKYIAKDFGDYRIHRARDMKKQISGALYYLLDFMSWWQQAKKDALKLAGISINFNKYKGTKNVVGFSPKKFYQNYIHIDGENRKIVVESKVHKGDELFLFDMTPILLRHSVPRGLVIRGQLIIKAVEIGDNLEKYLQYIPNDIIVEGDVLIVGSSVSFVEFFNGLKNQGQIAGRVSVQAN